jgi:uncharacterized DUF497 family protein
VLPDYEWDSEKEASNAEKHGVGFEEASGVFTDPNRIEVPSPQQGHGEVRYVATGMVGVVLITVVFTYRGHRRRIISARRASRDERREYGLR